MTGYVLSRRARRDLQDIWKFTANRWSDTRADNYVASIVLAVQKLSDGLGTSQSVELIDRKYQRSLVGSHAIFYRPSNKGRLEVVRILHQSMDVGRHLR